MLWSRVTVMLWRDTVTNLLANGSTAFIRKLCCHWLKGLWQCRVTSASRIPIPRYMYYSCCEDCVKNILIFHLIYSCKMAKKSACWFWSLKWYNKKHSVVILSTSEWAIKFNSPFLILFNKSTAIGITVTKKHIPKMITIYSGADKCAATKNHSKSTEKYTRLLSRLFTCYSVINLR